jgi:hypothetical protein
MVVNVLCCKQSAVRPDEHRSTTASHSRYYRGFPPARQDSGLVPCSAGDMGCLCGRFEFRDLEVEPLTPNAERSNKVSYHFLEFRDEIGDQKIKQA